MKIFKIFIITTFLLITVLSCLTAILDRPLTEEEEKFLGTWKRVIGIANWSSWEFNEYRNVRYYSTNPIWGDKESEYIWEADGNILTLYERNTLIAKVVRRYEYSFPSEDILVLDGSEYEKQ